MGSHERTRLRVRAAPSVLLALAAAAASAGGGRTARAAPAEADAQPGAWLDAQAPRNWNSRTAELPKAAPRDTDSLPGGPCAEEILEPAGREDKAVADAGWSVVSEPQGRSGTVVVTAATGADGMCRPLGVQAFVFVEGRFAGTLSPHPMDSRTDGILGRIQIFGSTLRADFRRYSATDPLCCPSRTSTVSYKLDTTDAGPLLVPGAVDTIKNPPAHR
jgi:LppP/LprE lipoprotein